MLQTYIIVAAWAPLAFITYAPLSPIQARPTLPIRTAVEHFAAFATLGGLFCLAYPKHIISVCALVFGSAALLEIAQLFTPDRHAHFADAMEKLAGGTFGIIILTTVRRLVFSIP